MATALNGTTDLDALVRDEALAAGFDVVRVTTPEAAAADIARAAAYLDRFLSDGRHGDMAWMATTADRRRNPRALWPEVRSIVMLGLNYGPAENPIATRVAPDRAVVSAYARGKDYHDIAKAGLKRVARALLAAGVEDAKVFVDTAPLLEKPLAAAAGIGWQGKHTNLVSREFGSWLFLGAILTTAELSPDVMEADHCGSCTRCLDACPTAAFPAPYQLDARRCIAYLTIEHKGHIAREFRSAIGNRVFGCDDCLAVCPWNKFAAAAREQRFAARDGAADPRLAEILRLDDAAFRARFAGTPVKRTGRDRVLRNALIAAGNSAAPALVPDVAALIDDPSPLVRAMAAWALARLDTDRAASLAKERQVSEPDAHVRSEWADALPGPART